MILKNTTMDEGMEKFDLLKSHIQSTCRIVEEAGVHENIEEDQEMEEDSTDIKRISMTIKSINNQFMELLEESSKDAP